MTSLVGYSPLNIDRYRNECKQTTASFSIDENRHRKWVLGLAEQIVQIENALKKGEEEVQKVNDVYLSSLNQLKETLLAILPQEAVPLVRKKLETDPQFIQVIVLQVLAQLSKEKDERLEKIELKLDEMKQVIRQHYPEAKL